MGGGYPGTNEVMLALERGDVEMSSTGNLFLTEKSVGTGAFKPLAQTGRLSDGKVIPRAEFDGAPLVSALMNGKIKDSLAETAFAYWRSLTSVDKWVVPGTPDEILTVYRDAFKKAGTIQISSPRARRSATASFRCRRATWKACSPHWLPRRRRR